MSSKNIYKKHNIIPLIGFILLSVIALTILPILYARYSLEREFSNFVNIHIEQTDHNIFAPSFIVFTIDQDFNSIAYSIKLERRLLLLWESRVRGDYKKTSDVDIDYKPDKARENFNDLISAYQSGILLAQDIEREEKDYRDYVISLNFRDFIWEFGGLKAHNYRSKNTPEVPVFIMLNENRSNYESALSYYRSIYSDSELVIRNPRYSSSDISEALDLYVQGMNLPRISPTPDNIVNQFTEIVANVANQALIESGLSCPTCSVSEINTKVTRSFQAGNSKVKNSNFFVIEDFDISSEKYVIAIARLYSGIKNQDDLVRRTEAKEGILKLYLFKKDNPNELLYMDEIILDDGSGVF
jgi:hypothetical protein